MKIRKITLRNFRNYTAQDLEIGDAGAILMGNNAQGKTNILEAIYVLSALSSFRSSSMRDLTKWGEDIFRLEASLDTEQGQHTLEFAADVTGGKVKRNLKLNDCKATRANFAGTLKVVLFVPSDLRLIDGSPSRHRTYLDRVCVQADKSYKRALLDLTKIIQHRNNILESIRLGEASTAELDVWDDKLIQSGTIVQKGRKDLVDYYNSKVSDIYSQVSNQDVTISVTYKTHEPLEKLIKEARPRDLATGITSVGPHRDDIDFFLDDKEFTTFGSRGEFRTLVLALKIAEIDYLRECTGIEPILLLDDVLSELDPTRRAKLIEVARKQQTIITTAENVDLGGLDVNTYMVENGTLKPINVQK